MSGQVGGWRGDVVPAVTDRNKQGAEPEKRASAIKRLCAINRVLHDHFAFWKEAMTDRSFFSVLDSTNELGKRGFDVEIPGYQRFDSF